jgi:hypothetical protein
MFCPACSGKSVGPCATPLQCGGLRHNASLRRWFESTLRVATLQTDRPVAASYNTNEYPIAPVEET